MVFEFFYFQSFREIKKQKHIEKLACTLAKLTKIYRRDFISILKNQIKYFLKF